MRIDKHLYTGGVHGPRKTKGPQLNKTFGKRAPFPTTGRSLRGRVARPQGVTKRGNDLSKQVGKIVGKIPSPFLINPKSL